MSSFRECASKFWNSPLDVKVKESVSIGHLNIS